MPDNLLACLTAHSNGDRLAFLSVSGVRRVGRVGSGWFGVSGLLLRRVGSDRFLVAGSWGVGVCSERSK